MSVENESGDALAPADAAKHGSEPVSASDEEGAEESQKSETAPDGGESAEASPEPKPKGVQKRLDELTRNWRSAERREQALLDILQSVRSPADNVPAEVSTKADSEPKSLADFEFNEKRYTEYVVQQAVLQARKAAQEEFSRSNEQHSSQERVSEFKKREKEFAKEVPDYMEVTRSDDLVITQDMVSELQSVKAAPAILYFLGKNPEVAEELAGMPKNERLIEYGMLRAKIESERQKKPSSVTKAPDPTPRLGASDNAPPAKTTDASGDVLSTDEWINKERQRVKKLGRIF